MTALDIAEVLALENRLFPQDAWPESFFYDELAHTSAGDDPEATRRYWVARTAAGELAGYVGMMCVLPHADVQTLAVAPEAQGQGLGTRLLNLLIAAAREQGAEQVLLEVRADNPGAQALYLREGFHPIHTRARYYPDGQDALIMQKPLTDLDAPSSAADLRSPQS
ncbi:ribosomal protein S18-alanine N-acetyltransferase [Nesterenkonia lutea]|nr:ribosomal protein S18-alanine N-acetyltransferase [Nesterenkonia lutea]